jgi:sugar phosphate isomerase/epimerase
LVKNTFIQKKNTMSENITSPNTRREFLLKSSMASIGLLMIGPGGWKKAAASFFQGKPNSKFFGVQIGVITYSFRSMPGSIEQILQYCVDSNINAIELIGDAAEDFAGKPLNPVKMPTRIPGQPMQLTDEQKTQLAAYQKQVGDWRSTVPMEKFKEIRKMYNKAGVSIYAFKPNALGPKNTDAEIEYALNAAKALGANCVTVELPADPAQSKRLGDFGSKHNVYIGYHAHLQATDTVWDIALGQSAFNTMNLDCGHYIAASENNTKETLLALIQAKQDRITSLHLKDRRSKQNGGENRVWGQGDTPITEILGLLKEKKYSFPATIELEYDIPAGSDAVKETRICLEYAKKALGA